MRGIYKSLIAVAVIAIVFIIALGYFGVISVPFVSPSIQSYGSATEIDYLVLQQYVPATGGVPSFSELESYGLTVHAYGTNDRAVSVRSYYASVMSEWSSEFSESDTGWSTTIWRNNLYGFGLVVYDYPVIKQRLGYNTVFVTMDGPASAWAPLLLNQQ